MRPKFERKVGNNGIFFMIGLNGVVNGYILFDGLGLMIPALRSRDIEIGLVVGIKMITRRIKMANIL